MKIYLNIPDSLQKSIDDKSIDLKDFLNERIDDSPIKKIENEELAIGNKGEKSILLVLGAITGGVIAIAKFLKALKEVDESATYFFKKYSVKFKKDENGYEKIVKELLSEDYVEKADDNIYVEIIKDELNKK